MLYFNGKGDPPTEEQVQEAKRRRGLADDLFALSMQNSTGTGDQPETPEE